VLFGLRASGFRLPAFGFRFSASGFRLPAFGFRLSASGFRLPAFGFGFGFRLRASGFRASGTTILMREKKSGLSFDKIPGISELQYSIPAFDPAKRNYTFHKPFSL
jgi:hypothetical protein